MAKFGFILTGDADMTRLLNRLGGTRARSVMMRALRAAARPILARAKEIVPVATGKLRSALTTVNLRSRSDRIGVVVSNRAGHLFAGKTYYGGFQEFGWKTGARFAHRDRRRRWQRHNRSVNLSRREIPGTHFMERAGNEREAAARDIYREQLGRFIEMEART